MPGAGPVKVITDKGVLEADPQSGELVLSALYPGVDVSELRDSIGWDLKAKPSLGDAAPPTAEELRLLREVLDPQKLYLKD